MNYLDARAARVRAIAEGNHGRVIGREGDAMTIEVPADVAPGLFVIWGEGKFRMQFEGQETRLAPRRVTDKDGRVIACPGDDVTTAFYRFKIDL